MSEMSERGIVFGFLIPQLIRAVGEEAWGEAGEEVISV